jgi:hypothetical protein
MPTSRLFLLPALSSLLACLSLAAGAGPTPTPTPEVAVTFALPFGAGGRTITPTSHGYTFDGETATVAPNALVTGYDLGIGPLAPPDFEISQIRLNFHFNGLIQITPQTGPAYPGFLAWTGPVGLVNGNSDIVLTWQPGAAYIGQSVPDFTNFGILAPAYAQLKIDTANTSNADLLTFENSPGTVTAQIAQATPEPGVIALLGGLLTASAGYWTLCRRRAGRRQD